MNAKELAGQLTGTEYPVRISGDLLRDAKAAGLVIIYGSSDDLMELDGAIHDEVDCYEGCTIQIDQKGVLPIFELVARDQDKDELRDYFRREGSGKPIEAVWGEDGYSWTYKTEIPHETFEVVEDGEPYCRGIVFSLADLAEQPSPVSAAE